MHGLMEMRVLCLAVLQENRLFTGRAKIMNKIRSRISIRKTIVPYAVFLVMMLTAVMNKKNLHVDEMFSYILSNNYGWFSFEDGHTYAPAEQIYLDNFSVNDAAERFDFANVWKNQTEDVHPPLYYVLLHIVCSLHTGKFSIWYAAEINICFALLTLYILRKLMRLFVDDNRFIECASIIFVLSAGILQSVSFLRMYVMAMFWVTLTAYLFVRAFDEDASWKRWTQIGLMAIAGALTHYYCIIYLCATCLVFGICLIIQKRWREIADLIGYMALSAGISIGIFPAMLTHMFSGYRGAQSIDTFTQTPRIEQWERLKTFYMFINSQMFGKIGGVCIIFVLLVVTSHVLSREKSDRFTICRINLMRWLIVSIPVIIYFLFVSESAVYITDRYLFPVYAVAFGILVCTLGALMRKILSTQNVYIILCLVGAVFAVNGFVNTSWEYLYKSSEELLNKAQTYSDKNCIAVYDTKWKEQQTFNEVKNYKSVTFIPQENAGSIIQYDNLFEDSFMLTVSGGNDDSIIHTIQDNYPYLTNCETVGAFAYTTTYCLSIGDNSVNLHIYNYDRTGVIGADSLENGGNVILVQDGPGAWIIRKDEEHALVELSRGILDVPDSAFADGANVQLCAFNGSETQRWKFVGNEDGSFSILAYDEIFALTGGSDGNVYLAEYHEGEGSQKWWIE